MEIATVGQCVLELILNALDAQTTGVAVRFDSDKKKIQVIDNGRGIPPDVLLRIGESEKKNGSTRVTCYTHTTKGESLKQIIDLSQTCIITSKHGETPGCEKVFKTEETPVFSRKNWLNKGTVVTIYGFDGSGWDTALNRFFFIITSLALIYTDVSFTLQDQKTDKLAVAIGKPHEPYSILNIICQQTISLKTSWHLNSEISANFKICGYIGFCEMQSTSVRQIFVNRRNANCLQIQKLIQVTMKELGNELDISSTDDIYFVIFIQCSEDDFILSSYEGRTFVIFEEWLKFSGNIENCLLNAIKTSSDNFVEPGSSSFPESSKHDGIQDYLRETNNLVTRQSNEENCSNISSPILDKRISIATQTSLPPPTVRKYKSENPTKKSETKPVFFHNEKKMDDKEVKLGKPFPKKDTHSKVIGKKKKAFLKLMKDSQETENPLKAKLKKVKPLQIPKRSLKDIFNRQISKSTALNKSLFDKNVKRSPILQDEKSNQPTKKSVVDRNFKSKKNSIFRKYEHIFKKPFGSHRITMTQISTLKSTRRDKLREQRRKREAEKQNALKRSHDQFSENEEKSIDFSDFEFGPNAKIIKKMKTRDGQHIIAPRRNEIVQEVPREHREVPEIPRNYKFFKNRQNVKNPNCENSKVELKKKTDRNQQIVLSRSQEIVEEYLKNQEKVKNSDFAIYQQEEIVEKLSRKPVSRNDEDFSEQYLLNPRQKKLPHSRFLLEERIVKKMKIEPKRENHDDFINQFFKNQKKVPAISDVKILPNDEFEKMKINAPRNYRDIYPKFVQNEMKNAEIYPEERMMIDDKIIKLNECQNVIERLRNHRKYYLDKNDLNRDIFRISRNPNNSELERRIQLKKDKRENHFQEINPYERRNHFYDEEAHQRQAERYNSLEKAIHHPEDESNFKYPGNPVIKIANENAAKVSVNRDSYQFKSTRDNSQQKVSNEENVNEFVAGENNLQSDINNFCQTIDSEHCSQLSEWSDWNYVLPISKDLLQVPESKKVTDRRIYYFLPPIFNSMLLYEKSHILSDANIQNTVESVPTIFMPKIKPDEIVSRYQNLNVRLCVVPHANEFNLNRKSLYSIKILKQVNSEFIAAIAVQDNLRLLLMIDQHAADERIRYEDLLRSYRIDRTKQYYSIVLDYPISIPDLEPRQIKLLSSNEKLLGKFGIQLRFSSTGCLMVTNVPRCFLRRKSEYSEFKLISSVKNLLAEIIESLETTNGASILPKSIHNSIASEACRGAIKFGDLLTNDQCNLLIDSLRKAKAPNRCAHGRPVIVPLLDVTDLKKKQKTSFQKKLNFASLMKNRKN